MPHAGKGLKKLSLKMCGNAMQMRGNFCRDRYYGNVWKCHP